MRRIHPYDGVSVPLSGYEVSGLVPRTLSIGGRIQSYGVSVRGGSYRVWYDGLAAAIFPNHWSLLGSKVYGFVVLSSGVVVYLRFGFL